MLQYKNTLVWFRRDLRDYDHAALYQALKNSEQVFCVFVFDTEILDQLSDKADRRVEFIWESVNELKTALQMRGGDLIIRHGVSREVVLEEATRLNVEAVFSNRDYEPSANARDEDVASKLAQKNIAFHQFKDQVLFEKDEVLTQQAKPYGVFTPYKNAHLKKLNDFYLQAYPVDNYIKHLAACSAQPMPSLESMSFQRTNLAQMKLPMGMSGAMSLFEDFTSRIRLYQETRNFPAIKGPSYLSVHLRFGTISIRHLARTAYHMGGAGAETWLNELIWRDFYFQILHHNPKVAAGNAYKAEFDAIPFPNNKQLFKAWCDGMTGYPLIDAAMRQLNQTGYMHNRLRMVAASFLVKDLLIDWRWGERYFAEKLIDFDLSANNGGWQWAASTGCDAQPWFRIFNPITQSEKFDASGKFIRKYVPELGRCEEKEIHAPWLIPPLKLQAINIEIGKDYPPPVVDHSNQREQALALYKNASNAAKLKAETVDNLGELS
ncbi:MAG: Deoxyribodipyrimidine photo-lyase [Pseudomonadota bacterium]